MPRWKLHMLRHPSCVFRRRRHPAGVALGASSTACPKSGVCPSGTSSRTAITGECWAATVPATTVAAARQGAAAAHAARHPTVIVRTVIVHTRTRHTHTLHHRHPPARPLPHRRRHRQRSRSCRRSCTRESLLRSGWRVRVSRTVIRSSLWRVWRAPRAKVHRQRWRSRAAS